MRSNGLTESPQAGEAPPPLVEAALAALHQTTGINGVWEKNVNHNADGAIRLHIGSKDVHFHCEIKKNLRRVAEIMDYRVRALVNPDQVLVTTAMSSYLAAKCKEQGIQFIDTVGNAYIRPYSRSEVFVFVSGNKPESAERSKDSSISTSSALKLIFALIADPRLLNQPYREMANAAQVAIGSVSQTINALERRGFIAYISGTRTWSKKEKLIGEWVAGYAGRLRPKLETMTFSVPDIDALRDIDLDPNIAVWGGEEAVARLTRFLKPEIVTIYTATANTTYVSDLVRRFKMRKDPYGTLQIVQPFWDLPRFASPTQCAPQLSIYADLLLSGDSRNIEAAQYVLRELALAHV
jgi:hypothetical protein